MANPARPWYRPRLRTLLMLSIVGVVLWSLYSFWSDYSERAARRARELMSPAPGAVCKAVLRSDAIGVERSGARAAQVNGTSNYVLGSFVQMNDDWLVLLANDPAGGSVRKWIPREQILVLEEQEAR